MRVLWSFAERGRETILASSPRTVRNVMRSPGGSRGSAVELRENGVASELVRRPEEERRMRWMRCLRCVRCMHGTAGMAVVVATLTAAVDADVVDARSDGVWHRAEWRANTFTMSTQSAALRVFLSRGTESSAIW